MYKIGDVRRLVTERVAMGHCDAHAMPISSEFQ